MRVTITIDSATPHQIWNLTAAFQRTAGIPLPPTATAKPMVTVAGSAMGWESPAMTVERAETTLREWKTLRDADVQRAAQPSTVEQLTDAEAQRLGRAAFYATTDYSHDSVPAAWDHLSEDQQNHYIGIADDVLAEYAGARGLEIVRAGGSS